MSDKPTDSGAEKKALAGMLEGASSYFSFLGQAAATPPPQRALWESQRDLEERRDALNRTEEEQKRHEKAKAEVDKQLASVADEEREEAARKAADDTKDLRKDVAQDERRLRATAGSVANGGLTERKGQLKAAAEMSETRKTLDEEEVILRREADRAAELEKEKAERRKEDAAVEELPEAARAKHSKMLELEREAKDGEALNEVQRDLVETKRRQIEEQEGIDSNEVGLGKQLFDGAYEAASMQGIDPFDGMTQHEMRKEAEERGRRKGERDKSRREVDVDERVLKEREQLVQTDKDVAESLRRDESEDLEGAARRKAKEIRALKREVDADERHLRATAGAAAYGGMRERKGQLEAADETHKIGENLEREANKLDEIADEDAARKEAEAKARAEAEAKAAEEARAREEQDADQQDETDDQSNSSGGLLSYLASWFTSGGGSSSSSSSGGSSNTGVSTYESDSDDDDYYASSSSADASGGGNEAEDDQSVEAEDEEESASSSSGSGGSSGDTEDDGQADAEEEQSEQEDDEEESSSSSSSSGSSSSSSSYDSSFFDPNIILD